MSLLAPQEDDTPFLSSGPALLEESTLSLISQSNPNPDNSPPDDAVLPVTSHDSGHSVIFRQSAVGDLSNSTIQFARPSFVTLLAGTFALFEIFLVWASLLSHSWFDTYIRAPEFPLAHEKLLHSTTPASLLSALAGAEQRGAFALLVISVLFPCLCMILNPIWIAGDHRERLAMSPTDSGNQQTILFLPRLIFENLLRFSLLVFFILAMLNVGTSSIEIVVRDADMIVFNRIRAGLLCYVLGIASAVGTVIVLRMARHLSFEGQNLCFGRQTQASSMHRSRSLSSFRVPPARAFQLPWRASVSPLTDIQSQMQPLLEGNVGSENEHQLDERHASTTTPDGTTACPRGMRNLQLEDCIMIDERKELSFCQKILLYNVGTMATLLWIPALFLPLFTLSYDGLASDFMSEVTHEIRLFNLPVEMWKKGRQAGTSSGIQLVLGIVLIISVYALPMLATIAAVASWTKQKPVYQRRICRRFLKFIHPALCGVVLVAALHITVPAFAPILDYVMDDYTSGFCEQIQTITGEACLAMDGSMGLGGIFLTVQTISLEVFMVLTMLWGI